MSSIIQDYQYTENDLTVLLNSMVILNDTREKENSHITDYFDNKLINYKSKALDYGDYSILLPQNKDLGIIKDINLSHYIAIERKANLTELSGNFTQGRKQFRNEMIRGYNSNIVLLIEDEYKNLINGNYRTQFNPRSYLGSLLTWENRYNFKTIFEPNKELIGHRIYWILHYYLRFYLMG